MSILPWIKSLHDTTPQECALRRLQSALLLFSALIFLPACLSEEEYSISPNDLLTFSTDTVAFDTIITGNPTNTYSFIVYNRGKKALRIPTVALERRAESPFKVVVDGTTLFDGVAHDFEIASKDSLIVYLMAKLPTSDNDTPVETTDKILFVTEGGAQQEVVLTASGQDVEELRGFTIDENITLSARRPYRIIDSLVVNKGITLTLAAGTRLYFHPSAKLIVDGTLKVEGTLQNPVVMRGDRLGNMFDGQPYDRVPAQWGGVVLRKNSYENEFNHLDLHSSTFGIQIDSGDVKRTKLTMHNSVVHNTARNGISARMAKITIGNSQITNAGGNCVDLHGGDASFIHCTIGRFFVFTGGNGVALAFSNHDGSTLLPLTHANFINCIITGYASDEIIGTRSDENKYPGNPFNYQFCNCLLNTPRYEDEKLVNCLWDEEVNTVWREKNFTPGFDLDALIFSFELNSDSPAVGTADPATAVAYPTDRLGRKRNATAPSMGCYEFVEKPEIEK